MSVMLNYPQPTMNNAGGFNYMQQPSPQRQGFAPCCLPSPPLNVPPPSLPPTNLPPPQSLLPHQYQQQQQQQQMPPRRLDLGYESEDKDSEHCGQSSPASSSRPASPCDSARPESPDAADVSQLTEDLAGFRVDGPRPVDMALSQQMEIVWHERFIDFFSRFPYGSWHLYPVFDPPDVENTGIPRNQWRYCKDQAKVRFICTTCQKAWTSMGGQVVFWIYKDDATNTGYVHFKLYGQKCSECKNSPYYEHAIWYQEEVEKVMENLYHQVGHMYYGMPAQKKRVDRRMGHPKREHNAATCQACRDRVCRMGQLQKRKARSGKQQQQSRK